jgi:hypothetical protein
VWALLERGAKSYAKNLRVRPSESSAADPLSVLSSCDPLFLDDTPRLVAHPEIMLKSRLSTSVRL